MRPHVHREGNRVTRPDAFCPLSAGAAILAVHGGAAIVIAFGIIAVAGGIWLWILLHRDHR